MGHIKGDTRGLDYGSYEDIVEGLGEVREITFSFAIPFHSFVPVWSSFPGLS